MGATDKPLLDFDLSEQFWESLVETRLIVKSAELDIHRDFNVLIEVVEFNSVKEIRLTMSVNTFFFLYYKALSKPSLLRNLLIAKIREGYPSLKLINYLTVVEFGEGFKFEQEKKAQVGAISKL